MSTSSNTAEADRGSEPPLRSKPSRVMSFVRFHNASQRNSKLIWVNYQGEHSLFRVIGPGGSQDVNTFCGHPWLCEDNDTGDKLILEGKTVYDPIGYNLNDGWPPVRREVKISIPVYSLLERCLQVIRDSGWGACLLNRSDVPNLIKEEIRKVVHRNRN